MLRDALGARSAARPTGGFEEGGLFASIDGLSKITWSLPEQIANKLVEDIICGTYSPGQRLQETSIAEEFGVSRGPVREALRIVEREGLANIRPRYGAFVAKLSAKNVTDIFEVRSLLLALAARRIGEEHTEETLAFLREGAAGLEDSLGRQEQFLPLVYRCSIYVAERIENNLARGILASLARQTLPLTRVALLREDNRRLWTQNWAAVVSAVTRRDPAGAERAMRKLVEDVCSSVLQILGEAQETFQAGANNG